MLQPSLWLAPVLVSMLCSAAHQGRPNPSLTFLGCDTQQRIHPIIAASFARTDYMVQGYGSRLDLHQLLRLCIGCCVRAHAVLRGASCDSICAPSQTMWPCGGRAEADVCGDRQLEAVRRLHEARPGPGSRWLESCRASF